MSKIKLGFMELFIKGKIDYKTYDTILGYLNMIGE